MSWDETVIALIAEAVQLPGHTAGLSDAEGFHAGGRHDGKNGSEGSATSAVVVTRLPLLL